MKNKFATINIIALIITIIFNYLSNSGFFNGNTMGSVSARYSNLFTPAGYAFSIWGLIYLGLIAFSVYGAKISSESQEDQSSTLNKISYWFLISCICNSLWVVAWLYDFIGWSVVLMILLFISLMSIVLNLKLSLFSEKTPFYLFLALPFTLYVGWVSVALIANMAAFLTQIGWAGWGIKPETWTITMIIIAGIVNLYIVSHRNMRAYGLVGIWALLAIAANQEVQQTSITYACYATSLVILLGIIANLFRPKYLNQD